MLTAGFALDDVSSRRLAVAGGMCTSNDWLAGEASTAKLPCSVTLWRASSVP